MKREPIGAPLAVAFIAFVTLMFCLGWLVAHDSIARECDRLGGFYYGEHTYSCWSRSK